jgi:hypothetical protein
MHVNMVSLSRNALVVVRVPLLADETRLAASAAGEVLTTALLENLEGAAGASGAGGGGARGAAARRAGAWSWSWAGARRAGVRRAAAWSWSWAGARRAGVRRAAAWGWSWAGAGRGAAGGSRGGCWLSDSGEGGGDWLGGGLVGVGGRSRRCRRARRRAVPDSRARNGVAGEGVVDVEENAGVGGLVNTGDGNTGGKGLGAGRGDLDLDTLHVELGATLAVTLVQGDDLRTEQVLAGGDVGNSDRMLAPVGDQVINSPFAVRVALLGDLDPAAASSALLGGSDVGQDGTPVGVSDDVVRGRTGVVVPLEGDLVTSLDGQGLGDRVLAVDVAGQVGGGDIGDRAVVGGSANVSASGVSRALVHVVDPDGVDGGVGVDEFSCCCQSEQSEGRLHFERVLM